MVDVDVIAVERFVRLLKESGEFLLTFTRQRDVTEAFSRIRLVKQKLRQ